MGVIEACTSSEAIEDQLPEGLDPQQHRIIITHWLGIDPNTLALNNAISGAIAVESGRRTAA